MTAFEQKSLEEQARIALKWRFRSRDNLEELLVSKHYHKYFPDTKWQHYKTAIADYDIWHKKDNDGNARVLLEQRIPFFCMEYFELDPKTAIETFLEKTESIHRSLEQQIGIPLLLFFYATATSIALISLDPDRAAFDQTILNTVLPLTHPYLACLYTSLLAFKPVLYLTKYLLSPSFVACAGLFSLFTYEKEARKERMSYLAHTYISDPQYALQYALSDQ